MYNKAMTHTLRIQTAIPASRKLQITLPTEVPSGEADLVVSITPRQARSTAEPRVEPPKIRTFTDLLTSEFVGMWADRDDLPVTNEEFSDWRRRLWERE